MEDITALRGEAEELKEQGKHKDTENIYDKIISLVHEEYEAATEGDRDSM